MELSCKEDFARHGISLLEYGNCVACYCTTGCGECVDDGFCNPDFLIQDLNIPVEVTGYNHKTPIEKPGMRLDWTMNVTKCKVENFVSGYQNGAADIGYVYHYANIFAYDKSNGGKKEVILKDHIRIIRMDGSFISDYQNQVFEVRYLSQDVMICIPPDSKYVISPGEMFEEVALLTIANKPGWC